jgi:integration host factor subunit beta
VIKSELVERVAAQNPHLYRRDIENIVGAMLGEIVAVLSRSDRVEIRGFGAFSVRNRRARTGRNPRSGAVVVVDQKSKPSSSAGRKCASASIGRRCERPPSGRKLAGWFAAPRNSAAIDGEADSSWPPSIRRE